MEDAIINYLNRHNQAYTKTLYKALRIKDNYNLSLNKFRGELYKIEKQGKIRLIEYQALSCWSKL
jgi:hypothetical protein